MCACAHQRLAAMGDHFRQWRMLVRIPIGRRKPIIDLRLCPLKVASLNAKQRAVIGAASTALVHHRISPGWRLETIGRVGGHSAPRKYNDCGDAD